MDRSRRGRRWSRSSPRRPRLGVAVTVAAGRRARLDRRGRPTASSTSTTPASAPHALGLRRHHAARRRMAQTIDAADRVDTAAGYGAGGRRHQPPSSRCPPTRPATKLPTNVDTGAAGRGVPDVVRRRRSADRLPVIRVDGAPQTVGGTSAVAPLWAGLTARPRTSRRAVGVRAASAVPAAGQQLVSRHHLGQQRLVCRRARLGCVHRAGLSRRHRAGGGAVTVRRCPHGVAEALRGRVVAYDPPVMGGKVWFLTGSQHLYGEETLRQVHDQARQIAAALDELGRDPGPGRPARHAHRRRRHPPSVDRRGC